MKDDDKGINQLYITGYVDSQNGFGAMVRSDFSIAFNRDNNKLAFIKIGKEFCYTDMSQVQMPN